MWKGRRSFLNEQRVMKQTLLIFRTGGMKIKNGMLYRYLVFVTPIRHTTHRTL